MKIMYAANARIPSEKAHPYQIMQMCEAFAWQGADVTLLYPNRHNPPELRVDDIHAYYGIDTVFTTQALPSLDLFPLASHLPMFIRMPVERVVALLQMMTYMISLFIRIARHSDAIFYSRDTIILLAYSWLWPRRARRAYFEAHTFTESWLGLWIRTCLAARLGGMIVITDHLRQRYTGLTPSPRLIVAHDGFRQARFQIEHDQRAWRARIGWPQDAYLIGYMGRFYSGLERMDKGLHTLLEAAAIIAKSSSADVRLALVGGPPEKVAELHQHAAELQLHNDFILYAEQVPAADVPGYLQAFDVCTIPSPWTTFYAYYTSPMKLFEYMASGKPLVASDLPSTAEIIRDGENGLLVPSGNVEALAAALQHLQTDPALANRIAEQAARDVLAYTWSARAGRILTFISQTSED